MSLNNLGAALKFGMDLEEGSIELYQKISRLGSRLEEDVVDNFLRAHRARRKMLERLYNDNLYSDMDTGIFEPICSLREADYIKPADSNGRMDDPEMISTAAELEERCSKFYNDLAKEIESRLRAVARTLKNMAKENLDRRDKLHSLLDQV
jgi:hypothetical protein